MFYQKYYLTNAYFLLYCTLTECQETIDQPYGIIKSPYYPEHYKNNMNCSYDFEHMDGYCGGIQLTFFDFSLQNSPTCDEDALEIIGKPHCGQSLMKAQGK